MVLWEYGENKWGWELIEGNLTGSKLCLVCCLRMAPVISLGDGYGENEDITFWEIFLHVLPATGESRVEEVIA